MKPGCLSVVLLGFTIDDRKFAEVARKSDVMPTQTHRFAWNLVRALTSADTLVSLLSVLPVPSYPEYPEKRIRSSLIDQDGVSGISMGFLNVLILKHVSRFFSCMSQGMRFLRVSRPDVVLVHGVHTPFLLFARLLKHALNVQICVVMTDPPGVLREVDGRATRILKRLDRSLVKSLASGFDGAICLTPELATDFAPQVPSLTLEGFANAELTVLRSELTTGRTEMDIAYAGGIYAEYGVRTLVHAFRSIKDPNARLHLYGRGPLDGWVARQSEIDQRIRHHGLVAHGELMQTLAQASILVNPRPTGQGFVRYSFPSKLLEYMALGVPVVTTRLPGVPGEYFQYVQITDDDSPRALLNALESVQADYAGAAERARRGQEYVTQEKSVPSQGKRIAKFLRGLA